MENLALGVRYIQTGSISETVEDRQYVTINGLYEVVHRIVDCRQNV